MMTPEQELWHSDSIICISILSFCLKTHPDMRVPVIRNVTIMTGTNVTSWTLDKHSTNPHDAFFYIECICNAWFSIEIIVRYGKISPFQLYSHEKATERSLRIQRDKNPSPCSSVLLISKCVVTLPLITITVSS